MSHDNMSIQEVFDELREIIASVTNHDVDEIMPDSQFEDDLAIDLEDDLTIFKRIVIKTEKFFEINLDYHLFLDENPENQTVSFFAQLVMDEVNL